jgi:hypothetical protein
MIGKGARNAAQANERDRLRAEIRSLRAEVRRLRKELGRLAPPLATVLKRRGFTVYKKEPAEDLLLPLAGFIDRYYELLHKYSFRLFLRDAIKHQNRFTAKLLTRYSTTRTVRSYIRKLAEMGLAEGQGDAFRLAKRPVQSFGPTLEWYVAELLEQHFGAEVLWGVKFRRPNVGGDYDVLARLDSILLYAEVKSSPPKQIYDSEVSAFLDRVDDLAPDIAVFLMDTELRMKDKLVPMFEKALAKRSADPPAVFRLEREVFSIDDRIYIMNAKESISGNIGLVTRRHFQLGRALRTRKFPSEG